ncbi:MAG: hypothetical protein P4L86_11100 [Mycobacterium sp.]|nr:hypothetical protein [Mycobacterium sp.]
MNATSGNSILDFEAYLVVTTKYVVLGNETNLAAKLAEQGLSLEDAERIHQRIAGLFDDEPSQFECLKQLVGAAEDPNAVSLTYHSVLWPDFVFTATANNNGGLESAQYRRAAGKAQKAASPREQAPWSMDVSEFAESYGPVTNTKRFPLFDKIRPAHEYFEFEWEGRGYCAAFSWGLFLHASLLWD